MLKAFEICYVNLQLPNTQRRRIAVVRAHNKEKARARFDRVSNPDNIFKIIGCNEVMSSAVSHLLVVLNTEPKVVRPVNPLQQAA